MYNGRQVVQCVLRDPNTDEIRAGLAPLSHNLQLLEREGLELVNAQEVLSFMLNNGVGA